MMLRERSTDLRKATRESKNPPATYCCPRTNLPLHRQGATWASDDGLRYPVVDGVPVFLQHAPLEDKAGRAKLDALVAAARAVGWREAFEQAFADDRDMLDYVLDPSRARFLELLPLQPHSRVLEIGPGLGQFTRRLAARAQHVSALEVVQGQARFVRESCVQSGLDNVDVACGGDDCRLPYADASFDLVVLNLVFEWCGARDPEGHDAAQRRLLAQIERVLKPGGTLYLATKNRYALRYLIGKSDEHAQHMRFGSALPRRLMHWLMRRGGLDRPGGQLHSFRALRDMLRDAGLPRVEAYWAAPEVRKPDRLIPATASAIRSARREGGFRQGDMRSTGLLMPWVPSALVPHVMHGLVFMASKP